MISIRSQKLSKVAGCGKFVRSVSSTHFLTVLFNVTCDTHTNAKTPITITTATGVEGVRIGIRIGRLRVETTERGCRIGHRAKAPGQINYHILVSPDTSPRLKEAWTGRALPLVQQKEAEVSKTKLSRAYGSQLLRPWLRPWLFHPSVHPIDHISWFHKASR